MAKPNQTEADRQEQKTKFVDYFREVPVQKYAAMYVGVTEQTIINWLKEDVVFFNQVQEARADWVKKKANKVRAEFALERLEKEIWSERKEIKVEGNTIDKILEGYGLKQNDGQTEGTTEKPSQNKP